MDIKIDLVDKIPPGIPKVVIENYNEKETQSDAPKVPPTVESNVIKKEAHNDGILPHRPIHKSFSGIANKSGQILLFSEVTSMWHEADLLLLPLRIQQRQLKMLLLMEFLKLDFLIMMMQLIFCPLKFMQPLLINPKNLILTGLMQYIRLNDQYYI